MGGRLINNEFRNIWTGDTVAERTANMIQSYTVSTVSESDTVVILKDGTALHNRYEYYPEDPDTIYPIVEIYPRHVTDMTVAQFSDCGYLDFFRGSVSEYRQDEYSDHFCLYPSEVETLFTAYQEWKIRQEVREELRTPWNIRAELILNPKSDLRSENV